MTAQPIRLREKFWAISTLWSPRIVATVNDLDIKLARLRGDFVWHSHEQTDEAFLVTEGWMTIHFRDRDFSLGPGDLCVVPRGVEHKTSAVAECRVILIEAKGTVNTGDVVSEQTADPAARI